MAATIFSNAFNFASYRDGQVDPRTGQFSAAIRLATLHPEGAGTGRRDIYLTFSMNQLGNEGYGIGWSINETEAIPLPADWGGNGRRPSTRLKLASGESFPIATWRDDHGFMRFRYKTLKTFFVRHDDRRRLEVYHIDGSVETLKPVPPRNTYRTSELVFENGERFVFDYTAAHGRLERIRNETTGTEFLHVSYDNDGRIKRSRTLATGRRAAEMEFSFTQDPSGKYDLLEKITLPRQSEGAKKDSFPTGSYIYNYQMHAYDQSDSVRYCLVRIISPMGGRDEIGYVTGRDAGHVYGNKRLLYVQKWSRTPDLGQPAVIRKYKYSERHNFMGSPDSGEYAAGDDDTDFLDSAPDDYTYWCEESLVDSHDETKVVASTLTTFNKFHLMIEEKRTGWPFANNKIRALRSCTAITSIEYNQVEPNRDHRPPRQMKDQPHNLRIPKTITVDYVDSGVPHQTRRETTTITSDDFGNVTSRTDPSGLQTRYLYYPIAEEQAACPADPAGLFQRHLKEETVIAAPVSSRGAAAAGDTRKTSFTYVATSRLGDASGGYFVQRATEINDSGTVEVVYAYAASPTPHDKSAWQTHGRLQDLTTTIREWTGAEAHVSRTHFAYDYHAADHSLRETRMIVGKTGSEGQPASSLSADRRIDLATGLLLETGSYDGLTIHYDYDTVGRLTEEAVMKGTARQAARRYRYDYAQLRDNWINELILTPARRRVWDSVSPDREYATTYDGLGRPVASSETRAGKTRQIRTIAYDSCGGRRRFDTVHDWIDQGAGKEPRELQLVTQYDYDGWNEVCQTKRPDGSTVVSYRDYTDNTLTTGVWGDGMRITRYNAFGQIQSVALASALGQKRQTQELLACDYDGFGRRISWRDADRRDVAVAYDGFDRIVMQAVNHAREDARVVRIAYPPYTAAELPASIKVGNTLLGERKFDEFGRMTADVKPGIGATRYVYRHDPEDDGTYEGLKPSARVAPDGTRLELAYDPALDLVIKVTDPARKSLTYGYDAATGRMTRASSAAADNSFEYDGYLHLKQASTTLRRHDGSQLTTEADTAVVLTSHSPAGRLCRTARSGRTGSTEVETRYYDDGGRLKKIEVPVQGGPPASIEHDYDGQGRITKTTASLGGSRLATEVTFDAFGREAARSFHLDGRKQRSIHLTYNEAGKLTRRETRIYGDNPDGGGTALAATAVARAAIVETFSYDLHARLASYGCTNERPAADGHAADGGSFPRDSLGRQILSQSFRYDALDNIVTVETGFVGGNGEKQVRSYDGNVPGQLRSITNPATRQAINLQYDGNGFLTADGAGQVFEYDAFGRLSLSSRGGIYQYDALGRLVQQTLTFDYENGWLAGENLGNARLRYLRDEDLVLGRSVQPADGAAGDTLPAVLYAVGQSGSVIGTAVKDGAFADRLYTPYGEFRKAEGADTDLSPRREQIAFNGERFDAAAGLYHLGNGRRAYSPRLMIFLSPDPLSPFDGAGYGFYSYCRGDPANAVDPSGLFTLPAFNPSPEAGIALSVAEVTLSLAVYGLALAAVVSSGGTALAGVAAFGALLGVGSATFGLGSAILNKAGDAEHSALFNKISVVFGLSSLAVSGPTAVAGGVGTARGLKNASMSVQMAEAAKASLINFTGIGDKAWKTAAGLSAFGIGYFNLYHGIAAWYNQGVAAQDDPPWRIPDGEPVTARQPLGLQFRDTIVRLMEEEEAFAREVARIRGSFGAELYDGTA